MTERSNNAFTRREIEDFYGVIKTKDVFLQNFSTALQFRKKPSDFEIAFDASTVKMFIETHYFRNQGLADVAINYCLAKNDFFLKYFLVYYADHVMCFALGAGVIASREDMIEKGVYNGRGIHIFDNKQLTSTLGFNREKFIDVYLHKLKQLATETYVHHTSSEFDILLPRKIEAKMQLIAFLSDWYAEYMEKHSMSFRNLVHQLNSCPEFSDEIDLINSASFKKAFPSNSYTETDLFLIANNLLKPLMRESGIILYSCLLEYYKVNFKGDING